MPEITRTTTSLTDSASAAFHNIITFLPTLLGALVILVLGWIVAGFVAGLVEKGLEKTGFERVVARSGINQAIERSGANITFSHMVGTLIKWMIRLTFIQAAANILGMPQVTAIMNSIILFIPKVAVALAIIVIGAFAAGFVSKLVPALFANLTRYAIMGFAVTAALSQLEVAPIVVNSVFIALIGSIALAIGLSFGLGGREVANELMRGWFERSKKTGSLTGTKPSDRIDTAA